MIGNEQIRIFRDWNEARKALTPKEFAAIGYPEGVTIPIFVTPEARTEAMRRIEEQGLAEFGKREYAPVLAAVYRDMAAENWQPPTELTA